MKLRGTISQKEEKMYFTGKMIDNTYFEILVDQNDVELNDELTEGNTVSGWLYVIQEGSVAGRCMLKLPKPSMRYGRTVYVSEGFLMVPNLTIEDFSPKRTRKKKSS